MARATILHIEDNSDDVVLFEHACRKAGIDLKIRSVANGKEALAYLQGTDDFKNRDENPIPSLVVLDIRLPHLNGFDVLAWMRAEKNLRRLPVIVLSSSNQSSDIKRAYDLGANSYLVKPVSLEDLITLARGIEEYWLSLNQGPVSI
jgi:CheY-like chemotaxis protein